MFHIVYNLYDCATIENWISFFILQKKKDLSSNLKFWGVMILSVVRFSSSLVGRLPEFFAAFRWQTDV